MTTRSTAQNLRFLAHHDLAGNGECGEGMAVVERHGQRYLYLAHLDIQTSFSVLEVTDPRRPRLVYSEVLPHRDVRSNSLAIAGDVLLVAHEVRRPGLEPAGVQLYDIGQPDSPRRLAFFDCSGPQSRGTHWVGCLGKFAYLSTGMPDSRPRHPRDDQFPVIVDISTPARPVEVGRWWFPGTQRSDEVDLPPRLEHSWVDDSGYRSHNIAVHPSRLDRAYVGYLDAGAVVLDIADPSSPRFVGRLENVPPRSGFTHTVLPLASRSLFVITDESVVDGAADYPKLLWVADATSEEHPTLLASAPLPSRESFTLLRGRLGAHNVHENDPFPWSWTSEELVVGAFFAAGVRMYDLSDPVRPTEVAAFVPEPSRGSTVGGAQTNDVYVTSDGIVFAGDRCGGGLDVLELTGW